MALRRMSNQIKPNDSSTQSVDDSKDEHHEHSHTHDHSHSHSHSHSHPHSHSHSVFGHTHSRDEGPSQGAESIVKVLQGRGDRGSQITVVGLAVNIGLTVSKGAAGWFMNSAALLAEAGHSASDLLGDFVTLFAWRLSRRQPTLKYPYGFGKFEVLGTATVSAILIAASIGIGVHSLMLLNHHLVESAATMPAGAAQSILQAASDTANSVASAIPSSISEHSHSHSHGHGDSSLALDPNAAWFALISVIAKEWIYRATKRVADEERSSVLLANAIHHRSDAYTSAVAFVAILGTWAFPALPLDPIGGILVSLVILGQGADLFAGAFGELTDAGVKPKTRDQLYKALKPLVEESTEVHAVEEVRAMRSGALLFVDVRIRVSKDLTVGATSMLEQRIKDALVTVRHDVFEVRVKFIPADEDGDREKEEEEKHDGR